MINWLVASLLFISPMQTLPGFPGFCSRALNPQDSMPIIQCQVQLDYVLTGQQVAELAEDVKIVARDGTNMQRYDAYFKIQEIIHDLEHLKRYNYKWGTLPQSAMDNAKIDDAIKLFSAAASLLKPKTLLQLLQELNRR